MKDLLKYLRDYKAECVLAPLFKALEAAFELLVPLLIAYMIDDGIPTANTSVILRAGILLLALCFVGLIAAVLAQFFAARAAVGFSTALRHDLFAHLENFSFRNIDTLGTSTMITRITSDVNLTQSGVNMVLRLFLRSPFIVLGATILAFTIDARAALVFVVLIAVLSVITGVLIGYNIPMLAGVQAKLDALMLHTRENLSGARVIRAFGMQKEEKEKFTKANRDLLETEVKAGALSGLLNPLTYVCVNLFIVALIKVAGVRFSNGILTDGQIVALYNYMSQILIELIKFANLIVTVNKALAGAKRISAVFSVHSEQKAVASDAAEGNDAIVFDHVSLQYNATADEAVTDIDFRLKRGETLGIIGPTGSGKSTIAHLLAGFYDCTRGRILIDGRDVRSYGARLKDLIGIVLQKSVLFAGTIRSNLLFGKEDATEAEMLESLRIACCTETADAHGGLDGEVVQFGRNYSGGQRQRLCIARALVKKPRILILDDSSSALDYATDALVRENIAALPYHPTVLIISQRTVSIQNADHILVLDDGKAVGYGTHADLLETCETYREIHESQGRKTEVG